MNRFIFGTYHLDNQEKLRNALNQAIKYGQITRFDTAQLYRNESATADILFQNKTANITKSFEQQLRDNKTPTFDDIAVPEFTLQTKIREITTLDKTVAAIKKSLARLENMKPEIVIMHRPMPVTSWLAFERAVVTNLVKQIGVSNHNVDDLKRLLSYATIKPYVNQIEMHPFVPNVLETLRYCQENGIVVQGHSVLARGQFFSNLTIVQIAKSVGKTPAQVMLRWAYQHGVDILVNSCNVNHVIEWKDVPKFSLDDESMQKLDNLSKTLPFCFYPPTLPVATMFEEDTVERSLFTAEQRKAFVQKTVKQLIEDATNVVEHKPVSDTCLQLPSCKRNKNSILAKEIANAYFDATLTAESLELEKKRYGDKIDQSRIDRYRQLIKELRKALTEQRQKQCQKYVSHKNNVCLMRNRDAPVSNYIQNPEAMPVVVAPLDEVRPFFTWLETNTEPVETALTFKRGTVFPDGRMDFCKQVTGPEHIGALCNAIKKNILNTSFVKHFLLGNNIACQGDNVNSAAEFANLIKNNSLDIETWYLAGNGIGPNAAKVLADAFERNMVARALWLKRNPLGPIGASHIGKMLTINTHLTILDMDNCGLLDEGIEKFVNATNNVRLELKHLYVSANGITEKGASHLARFVGNNRLKTLYAGVNRMGDAGCLALARAFNGSYSLKRFTVNSNGITDHVMPQLIMELLTCENLICLDIGYYKSTYDLGEQPNQLGRDFEHKTTTALCNLIRYHPQIQYISVIGNSLSETALQKLESSIEDKYLQGEHISIDMLRGTGETLDDGEQLSVVAPPSHIYHHTHEELRKLKHSKRIYDIDSIYRTSMK